MLKKICSGYCSTPLIYRIGAAFVIGILAGMALSYAGTSMGQEWLHRVVAWISPFGTVLIAMLKMIVIPIIFFSLVCGASSLSVKKFGKLGGGVLLWYLFTSIAASVFGVFLATVMNPGMSNAAELSGRHLMQVGQLRSAGAGGGSVSSFVNGLFVNPFEALASGNFLPVIVFAMTFGIAARTVIDHEQQAGGRHPVEQLIEMFDAALKVCFKIIDWIIEYFPIGVLALTTANFALYGVELFGPYMRIALCVVTGVLLMIFVIYPLLVALICRENPYRFLWGIRSPIVTAFLTRSSAAALPVSMKTAEELKIRKELSSFALPLGATINMDGVCIHLPVFAILAANIFGIDLSVTKLAVLVVSVVFASVGAGGIPGGSIFLLFMVLANMGLDDAQTAMIVALAIGINPLLDMFETACNVTGDNVCNYIVARKGGMIDDSRG